MGTSGHPLRCVALLCFAFERARSACCVYRMFGCLDELRFFSCLFLSRVVGFGPRVNMQSKMFDRYKNIGTKYSENIVPILPL